MAKSKETFSKKEKEKKRFKQKQDKKIRTEERKANKRDGNSLEGMMAYLDENGNLTDSPPDPSKKKVFRQEDIPIAVTRQEDPTAGEFKTGTIAFFNKAKGFGFINEQNSNERVFFHIKDMLDPLEESDKVRFLVERSLRGLSALQVSRIG